MNEEKVGACAVLHVCLLYFFVAPRRRPRVAQEATVSHLDLRDNYIEDIGAEAIAKLLSHTTSLTSVDLRRNWVSSEGAKLLMEAYAQNPTVLDIKLGGNPVPESVLKDFNTMCASRGGGGEGQAVAGRGGGGAGGTVNRAPPQSPWRDQYEAKKAVWRKELRGEADDDDDDEASLQRAGPSH